MTRSQDQEHVTKQIYAALAPYIGSSEVRSDSRLGDYVTNSVDAASFILDISKRLGSNLSPTLFWQQPTIARLAAHLCGDEAVKTKAAFTAHPDRAIAVVGLACRFPGCEDAESYWTLLNEGAMAIDRARSARMQLFGGAEPLSAFEAIGGFLTDIERFDNGFFRISPREALCMDPQQRVLAEVTWDALESAGLTSTDLIDQQGGVFIGAMWSDYGRYFAPNDMDVHSAAGLDSSILSARLSYLLGVRGPSLTVNTACSSSLVAVHLACNSLVSGESDFAIAGGVNLIVSPHSTASLARFGGLSPTSSCKTFDAAADGYVRSEGCGVVILKRLDDAIASGDNILGVVAGSATNNNGYSASLTAPSREAQEQLLVNAYRKANTDPGDVSYVEVHGTGTTLGDPIEAHALASVLCGDRDDDNPLRVGSVKTNIGHCEAAAGIAGLIKVLLSMRHETLPAHLNFHAPNPQIPFDKLRLAVNDTRVPWKSSGGELVAGVSSFGFGGSNCHIVVKSWRDRAPAVLLQAPAIDLARSDTAAGNVARPPASTLRTAFVFPGQGSQWPQMGRTLLTLDPEFRGIVQNCDDYVRNREGWSIVRVLLDADGAIDNTKYLWPSLTAVQIALAATWQDWGLRADAVVGHSIGEIAAAQCAGALSVKDALDLSVAQSRWAAQHQGAMALVKLGWEETESLLSEAGCKRTHRAVQHDPASTIVSGSHTDILKLKKACGTRAIGFVPVRVKAAMHRPVGKAAQAELHDGLPSIRPQSLDVPFYASSLGRLLRPDELSRDYWSKNLTSPVLWMQAVSSAMADGIGTFVEIAPHPIMGNSLRNIAGSHGKDVLILASAERAKRPGEVMSASVRALAERGVQCGPRRSRSSLRSALSQTQGPDEGQKDNLQLIPVSAHSAEALKQRYAVYASYLEKNGQVRLQDVSYTCALKRSHHKYRAAIVTGSIGELTERLKVLSVSRPANAAPAGEGPDPSKRPVFLFSGDLAVSANELRYHPLYQREYERCDRALSGIAGLDDRLVVTFCGQVAIAAGLRSLGIEPSAVAGTGAGKAAAGYVAGYLTLDSAVALLSGRTVPAEASTTPEADHLAARCVPPGDDPVYRAAVPFLSYSTGEPAVPADYEWMDAPAHHGGETADRHDALKTPDVQRNWAIRFGNELNHPEPVAAAAAQGGDWCGLKATALPIDTSSKALLNVVAQFYGNGGDPPWPALQCDIGQLLDLPGYPWQRRKYWPEQPGILQRREPMEKRVSINEATLPTFLLAWDPLTGSRTTAGSPSVPRLVFAEPAVWKQLRGLAPFAQAKWVFRGSAYGRSGSDTFYIDPANPNDMRRLLQEAGHFEDVVYLWALALGSTLTDFATADDMLVDGPLHLVQSLIAQQSSQPGALWFVTAGSQAVRESEVKGAGQATLWGLGRTIVLEHPELRCRLIDVDPLGTNGELVRDAIWSIETTFSCGFKAEELAWRGRNAFSPMLRKSRNATASQAPTRGSGAGCTVITGGLGALGLKIAEQTVREGASQILLIGRSPPSPAAQRAIHRLEQSGADILALQADVSNCPDLDAALKRGLARFGSINAIYHAAGTLDGAVLSSTDARNYQRALRPKLRGGWNLHELTKAMPIQRFVLVSSVSSILGLPRYASYAAANAFLDALACERHRMGLPATSISFGPLADVGMATREDAPASFPGLPPVSISDAIAAVEQLSGTSAPHHVVMNFDAEAWEKMGLPYKVEKEGSAGSTAPAASEWESVTGPKRIDAIRHQVVNLLAAILKQNAAEISPNASFNSLGFDSLLSLEFRNRLQQVFRIRLPSTLIWSAPTAGRLAEALTERIEHGQKLETPIAPVIRAVLPGSEPKAQHQKTTLAASAIDEMSEAELEALLVAEIEAVNRQNA